MMQKKATCPPSRDRCMLVFAFCCRFASFCRHRVHDIYTDVEKSIPHFFSSLSSSFLPSPPFCPCFFSSFSGVGYFSQIAYMKQRRGSGAAKADKPTGGLTLGAWPTKAKKEADAAKVHLLCVCIFCTFCQPQYILYLYPLFLQPIQRKYFVTNQVPMPCTSGAPVDRGSACGLQNNTQR